MPLLYGLISDKASNERQVNEWTGERRSTPRFVSQYLFVGLFGVSDEKYGRDPLDSTRLFLFEQIVREKPRQLSVFMKSRLLSVFRF